MMTDDQKRSVLTRINQADERADRWRDHYTDALVQAKLIAEERDHWLRWLKRVYTVACVEAVVILWLVLKLMRWL